jgi:acyl-CoA synthetase (AMP-forming)/AMP-acid ligase II
VTETGWVSRAGIILRDLVPPALRAEWVERGYCPDQDVFGQFGVRVAAHPQRPAVVDGDGVVDYATLDGQARRIAAALSDAGLGARDIIAVQVPNDRRAVAAELAVAAIGAVALPWPVGRGRHDTRQLLGRSRAGAAIVAQTGRGVPLAAELMDVRQHLTHLRTVFVFGAAAGAQSLDPWLADPGVGAAWRPEPVAPGAPVRILVSSGSEAAPKMVAYSHHAMAGGRGNYVGALHTGPGPMRNLLLVPLSSSFGSCGTYVTIARHGGTLLLQDGFDPAAALRMISRYRPTHVFAVPTMLSRIAAQPRTPDEDVSGVRAFVSSGAALHPAAMAECRARFGRPVVNVYGSADGVNCHTAGSGGTGVGRPDPAVADIRVLDDAGRPQPAGQPGEICALGPMTPLCYVADTALDARYRLPGGWVRTGDRGLRAADGTLHVLDRLKQVVIRGGNTISPAEIEQQVRTHPGVADVACVGVPDRDLGERLCAFVVRRPAGPALSLAGLTRFLLVRRGLPRRKLPDALYTVDELPLGPTGKVCRHTLARLATCEGDGQPGRRPRTV